MNNGQSELEDEGILVEEKGTRENKRKNVIIYLQVVDS